MNITTKLTKRQVESIAPLKGQEIFAWDSELKGFGLRVFPTGRRTYFVQYRNQFGRTRRKKMGVHGVITAEQAREQARMILGDVARGDDPSHNHKQAKKQMSLEDLARDYMELYAKTTKRPKSLKNDSHMLSAIILPKLGVLKLNEVTSHELQQLHKTLKDTPYLANRVRSLLSKMFNLAKDWGWMEDNPTLSIEKYHEEKRDRWLNDKELEKIWATLDRYPTHFTAFVFKLLLLTGARKGELLNATWDQFDLKKGIWTKPSHLTKQKKKEHLPLSEQAVDLLLQLKSLHVEYSPFLFPGKVEGKPLQEIKTFWKTVLKEAGIKDLRIHDLRHTHASHLVSSGLSLSIVGKLLGHTQASTTQRYAHLADEPLRAATEVFGKKVSRMKATPKS